jgi:hypothetical protein
MIIFSIAINFNSLFAASSGNFLQDILDSGKNFFNPNSGTQQGGIGDLISDAINNSIFKILEQTGNIIFFTVAAFLGLKYIWSGVEGKSQVKGTLPTFVVAASVFYLADTVYNVTSGVFKEILSGTTYESIQNSLWANISIVVNIFAIAGIAALGLKYMFSSADTKADIKKDMVPVAIGLVLIYAISSVLKFLVSAGADILP